MKLIGKEVVDGVKYFNVLGRRFRYGEVMTIQDLTKIVFEREESIVNRILQAKTHADIYQCAAIEHQKTFPKYRNCNAGKDMVLLASGPTLDFYNVRQDAMYIGVNRSFYAGKADLDYLFVQDYFKEIQNDVDAYRGHDCRKFYGVHYLVSAIAQCHADKAGAERYYFVDMNAPAAWNFPPDVSLLPFSAYGTVVFPAATFAVYTGIRRLYLVGCDSTCGGYSKNLNYKDAGKNVLTVRDVVAGWRMFKDFVGIFYPYTEIVSVNPVGLRGIFHDVYTKEYLAQHPEIKDAELLEETEARHD